MRSRREPRTAKLLPVRIRGLDRGGNHFAQNARTVDISRSGARLDWVKCLQGPGEIIEVQRGSEKACFRVVWMGQIGTPQDGQTGIFCVEAGKYIWGTPLPSPKADSYEFPQSMGKADAAPDRGANARLSIAPKPTPRRSVRLDLQVRVMVRWIAPDGSRQEKETTTLVVNEHGCLVPLNAAVMEGMTLELVNRSTNEARKGKVIWCGGISSQGGHQVGIELEEPGVQFWGPQYFEGIRLKAASDTWVG